MASVTVVIPTHNRSGLLARTLRSALAQRGVELTVVVVDDGSTDATCATVASFGDDRVHLVRHERAQGVSAARNRGVADSQSDWVAFLDDDDLWAPDKLRLQIRSMEASGRWWSFAGSVLLMPTLTIAGGGASPEPEVVWRELPIRNIVPGGASSVVVHRSVLARVGNFDTSLRHMSDWDLWIRIGQTGPPAGVDDPLVAYRLHAGNASIDTRDIARELSVLEERYVALRNGARVDRAYVYRWIAWSSLRMGRRGDALRAYAEAVKAGDLASVARAIVGALHPPILEWRLQKRTDPSYAARAAEWLGPLLG